MTREKGFAEFYVSETNRRLQNIETDLKHLTGLRSQVLALSLVCNAASLAVLLSVLFIYFK